MFGCVEGTVGMRPVLNGIRIAPSIPRSWKHLEIDKNFRGRHLHILVENPEEKETGYTRLLLNGIELSDNYIPEEFLKEENQILLIL